MVIAIFAKCCFLLFNYPFVTLSLCLSRFLGLNMIVVVKPLIDSGLTITLLYDSNKTTTKGKQKRPFSGPC